MRRTLLLFVMLLTPALMAAQVSDSAADPAGGIRAAMDAQVAAWNRGDIPAFMQTYEKSEETTFVGTTVRKGYEPLLKHYQMAYSNAEQMGKLTFSELDIRILPSACGQAEYAAVTGRFHLDRIEKGTAKNDDGIFSLVWHRGPQGWKIVLDHTS